ncbi:MAG: glycosyltransferase [Christiangramia sp.]|uniref:glycosyltransferase family 2 protein n=1 Tax=Christiangramia sp. TaxID=1931228 RepID=UPI0032429994
MLAIVIPYFKKTFFENTLASLAVQTRKDFKVYIGNDASPEDPEDIIAKYASVLNISYTEFDENLGSRSLVKQWERCIALTGNEKWLMLLGDDDYLDPGCVEKFYENQSQVEKNKIRVIRFASRLFWEDDHKKEIIFSHPKKQSATDAFYEVYFGNSRSSLSEYIFSKKAYQKSRFREIPLAWGSDNLAWLDFSEGGDIYSINEAVVHIRMSSENISRKSFEKSNKNLALYKTFKIIVNEYLYQFTPKQRKDILMRYEHYTMLGEKISWKYWFKMSRLILKEFNLIEVVKFTRRCSYYSLNL